MPTRGIEKVYFEGDNFLETYISQQTSLTATPFPVGFIDYFFIKSMIAGLKVFGIVVTFRIFDTYLALILTYLVFTIPYAALMMTSYFNTLPKELDDAVLMDGGSSFTALCRVIIPISLPGIVATCVYTFLLCWNEFLFALTLTKSYEMRTVPIGIQLLMGQHAYEWNEMMAMSIIGTVPILFLYLFAQKYFLAGLTSGSVKF